jgi:hypothetical protein
MGPPAFSWPTDARQGEYALPASNVICRLPMAGFAGPRPSPDGKRLMFQASTFPPNQAWATERFLPGRPAGKNQ